MIEFPKYSYWDYWRQRHLWTVQQAVNLAVRYGNFTDGSVLDTVLWADDGGMTITSIAEEYAEEYKKRRQYSRRYALQDALKDMVRDAMDVGALKPFNPSEKQERFEDRRVRPRDFIRWAKGKGIEIPDELARLLESEEPGDANSDSTSDVPSKMERRVRSIQQVISQLDLNKLEIPTGGKQRIKEACLNDHQLFTGSTFDTAWKEARRRGLVKMADHDKFTH